MEASTVTRCARLSGFGECVVRTHYARCVTVLWGVTTRLRLSKLMLISRAAAPGDAVRLLDAGVDIVAVIDAHADEAAVTAAVATWRRSAPSGRWLLGCEYSAGQDVNTDVDFVNTTGRVAVSKESNPYLLVGRTCADVASVDDALADDGVDFLVVGNATGPDGSAVLRHAAERAPQTVPSSKPWFAVGGITAANLPDVLATGARRVAVSRAIAMAADPYEAAETLAATVKASWTDMDAVTLSAFRPNRAGDIA